MRKAAKAKSFALLELLTVLAIMLVIFYVLNKMYFSKSKPENKEIQKVFQEEGINTANYQTVLDSARSKVKEFNQETLNRQNEYENLTR